MNGEEKERGEEEGGRGERRSGKRRVEVRVEERSRGEDKREG